MSISQPSQGRAISRRRLLQSGGAALAFAYVYSSPLAKVARAAGSSTAGTPSYLVRSTYQDLTDYDFGIGGVPLRFKSVADFDAAAVQPNLAGNEDAFSVMFTGPAGTAIGGGPQVVKNAQIGDFTALVVPVDGQVGSQQQYELVVNRILNATDTHYRPPKAPPAPAATAPAKPPVSTAPVVSPQAGTATKKTHHTPAVRKITALRTRTGVRFTLLLKPGAHVRDITGWLKREETLIGATSRSVRSNKLAFNVKVGKKPRKGTYVLELLTTDRDGAQVIERHRVKLR
jgi:hypothetical protein